MSTKKCCFLACVGFFCLFRVFVGLSKHQPTVAECGGQFNDYLDNITIGRRFDDY